MCSPYRPPYASALSANVRAELHGECGGILDRSHVEMEGAILDMADHGWTRPPEHRGDGVGGQFRMGHAHRLRFELLGWQRARANLRRRIDHVQFELAAEPRRQDFTHGGRYELQFRGRTNQQP